MVTQTVQNVTRTDGRMVQVQGEFDATVVLRDSSLPSVIFRHPVHASIDGANLTVAGGNRSAIPFQLDQIDFIDISTYDTGASVAAIILSTLLFGGVAAGVTVLAIH